MLTQRPLAVDLKNMLINNEPFSYAHLVKFERPSRPDANGRVSTSRERYTYLTDASRDVNFDDGSTNLAGVPNGSQVYIANKVIKVGAVSEQTEAKASNYSLVLDGNGIGAYVSGVITVTQINSLTWDVLWPADRDLIGAGFREGDKITLSGAFTGDYNIQNFRANNVLRLTRIDSDLSANTGLTTMSLSSEEIKSILLDKNNEDYSSFVNREVFIYRAYFQEGAVVGSPVLLFKGIIANVAFDDTDQNIQVAWGLTSHWGDFAQVRGRITSDDFHRALDQTGTPQPQSALKVAYAYDKGFSHSETSINILATYSVQVEKQDVKAKNGFLGIGAKVKVKKYFVSEDRNTELDFQLQAKSIPVIYGVRNTQGTPIFADTLNDNSSTVYVVRALAEGEIGGIYDAYIDSNSLMCNDKADFDARSVQTTDNTVDLICRGRADRGDVLGGITSISNTPVNYYADDAYLYTDLSYNYTMFSNYYSYVPPAVTLTTQTGRGIVDGESITLTSPQSISLDFFSGKSGQKAASQLVEIAKSKNFKIQNSYWLGNDTAEYWGPNHRLLDTAYVVEKYVIEEGETTIPSVEYVVRGKNLECFNYDYSYSHYTKATGENADNFNLGDFVTLYDTTGKAISGSVQIIDKWTFCNPDGSLNTRFRWSTSPNLNYEGSNPTTTKFQMRSGSNNWTMVTWNYEEFRGVVAAQATAVPSAAVNQGGFLALSYTGGANLGSGGDPVQNSLPLISFVRNNALYLDNDLFNSNRVLTASSKTNFQYRTNIPYDANVQAQMAAAVAADTLIVSRNTIKLDASASNVSDFYNGYNITVSRYNASTDKQLIQVKRIIAYNGSTQVATIDDVWDADIFPKAGDVVVITPPYADKRVSINPAMQTLDYITSDTYGRGLNATRDLDLPSWLAAGRACDTQSNVTVYASSGTPSAGHVYRYPATGSLYWQGKVVGNDGNYVEFEEVLGKLTNSWNSWKSYRVNELVYADNRLYRVTAAGVKPTKPTHTGTANGLELLGGPPALTSVNGGPNLSLAMDGNPVRALKDGARISGYSLYDCDEIDYWRYLGWDEFSQRYVTRHQTNLMIDTSLPLFDNINSLLEHFGGILRYSGGKYYLDVEEPEFLIESSDDEVRNVTADHIIGKIRLSDEGVRSAFNSLTAAFADPGNKFESRNISFFNSNYLKADRNVTKKGNISVPGITNYYNTRILADKFLNKSRFGLTISFNMAPRGLILLSGVVIQLQYPRYGWVDKKFRITSLTHQEDCTVDIVAEEYDDSFYVLSKISKQAGTGAGGTGTNTSIGSPTNLQATSVDSGDETYSGVNITWINDPAANTKNVYTELYSSVSSHLYLTANTISGNVITTTVPHELQVGEIVTSQVTTKGLQLGKDYFVREIISTTKFTLSENRNGTILPLIDGTDVGAILQTASLIATLPTPTTSYVDVFGGVDGRVVKFYWVRHKVIRA
jgi:hypothetical protein